MMTHLLSLAMISTISLICEIGQSWAEGDLPQFDQDRPTTGYNHRLDQALGAEAGVQVYMDQDGNVGTIIDQGQGRRNMTVQPPVSQSRTIGPPLQLHNRPFSIDSIAPAPPPTGPDFPTKAK